MKVSGKAQRKTKARMIRMSAPKPRSGLTINLTDDLVKELIRRGFAEFYE